MIKERNKKKKKRNPVFRFENKSDGSVSTFIKQQPQVWCLIFSQCFGPRAQRSLCLFFQLEYVGFAPVGNSWKDQAEDPFAEATDPRDLKNQGGECALAAPHSPYPLPSRKAFRTEISKVGGKSVLIFFSFPYPTQFSQPPPQPLVHHCGL